MYLQTFNSICLIFVLSAGLPSRGLTDESWVLEDEKSVWNGQASRDEAAGVEDIQLFPQEQSVEQFLDELSAADRLPPAPTKDHLDDERAKAVRQDLQALVQVLDGAGLDQELNRAESELDNMAPRFAELRRMADMSGKVVMTDAIDQTLARALGRDAGHKVRAHSTDKTRRPVAISDIPDNVSATDTFMDELEIMRAKLAGRLSQCYGRTFDRPVQQDTVITASVLVSPDGQVTGSGVQSHVELPESFESCGHDAILSLYVSRAPSEETWVDIPVRIQPPRQDTAEIVH